MIGGHDVIMEVHALASSPAAVLFACSKHWPNSLYQNANENDAHPISEAIIHSPERPLGHEYFVYRDRKSYESWVKEGASPENADTMIHFILSDPEEGSHLMRLTMVSDNRSPEIKAIELTIKYFLGNPLGMLAHSVDPRFVTEKGDIDFKSLVLETYVLFFPKMHTVDVLFNPRIAIQFCDLVRMRINQPVPDNLILKTLFISYQDVTSEK